MMRRVYSSKTRPRPSFRRALIVVNDLLAQGTLAALHHCGIAVPSEMSVCSFDNVESSAFTIPALTTVESHAVRRGEEAARLALARLAQPQSPPMSITVPTKLIIRDSTGPARITDRICCRLRAVSASSPCAGSVA